MSPDIRQYIGKRSYQPVCKGLDVAGEIIWELKPKEPWHQKMYPVSYDGDFGIQWMYLSLYEKGFDWDEER